MILLGCYFYPKEDILELIRFLGHNHSKEVKGGIDDGKKAVAVPTRVSAGDRWAGALGAIGGVAGRGVRGLGVSDPEVGRAGRSGRASP